MQQQSQDKHFLVQRQRMQRLRKISVGMSVCLLFGVLYALWLSLGGPGIPCIFHVLTGLDCPSCGVTHMCMALLRLDIPAAWRANAAILCLLPVLLLIAGSMIGRYVKTGETRPQRWVSILIWSTIIVLLLFGLARNLIRFW